MAKYGITPEGFTIKRLDQIREDVHAKLSDGFGVNTRLFPDTFLDVLVTTFCGQIAELWEEAQDAYFAISPSTATGINLDNAVQFAGITRAIPKKTLYRIHCTGNDGTYVASSTIASDTMPKIYLDAVEPYTITRNNFYSMALKVVSAAAGIYTVSINGVAYEITAAPGDGDTEILNKLLAKLKEAPEIDCKTEEGLLVVTHKKEYESGTCELSNNLTTEWVTTIADYQTKDYGAIVVPNTVINTIITNTPGLTGVKNLLAPTLGRLRETDVELRQANAAKAAIRSSTMIDSVVSHLINNVDGVISCKGYENFGDTVDGAGRPPHSIEIIVDGGEDQAIASAILVRKSGGIRAYGNTEVPVLTTNGDTIAIGFSRPEHIYAWFKVTLHGAGIPGNAAQTVKDIIAGREVRVAETIYLQEYFGEMYQTIQGLTYVEITAGVSTSESSRPEYTLQQNIPVTYRQKILVSAERIEVLEHDT